MLEAFALTFLAPALVLALPVVVATWRRWQWNLLDLAGLAAPGVSWSLTLFVYGSDGRSLSNLIELPILAVLIAALAWLKGPIQRKTPDRLQPYWFLLAGVALGLTCYLAFPGLDE